MNSKGHHPTFYHMEKVLIGILYSPGEQRDKKACWGVEALMKQDVSQHCLKPTKFPLPYGLCLQEVDVVRVGGGGGGGGECK